MGPIKSTSTKSGYRGYNQLAQAETQVAPIYAIVDALIAKNKAVKRKNPFNSNLDDNFFKIDHNL